MLRTAHQQNILSVATVLITPFIGCALTEVCSIVGTSEVVQVYVNITIGRVTDSLGVQLFNFKMFNTMYNTLKYSG